MNPSNAKSHPVLQEIEFFSHLTSEQLHQIEQISTIKRFEEGEIVFYEGEESRYFHLLIHGEISIIKSSALTDTIAIHRFRAPSLIAEMATLKQIPYPASAKCMQNSTVLKISRHPFLELLRKDPALSIALISSLTQKISALELSLQRHSAPNAMVKVARLLRDDLDIFTQLKAIDIAHLIGITPETLSRMLRKFKQDGIISPIHPRGYAINDPVKLYSLSDNNFPFRDSVIQ